MVPSSASSVSTSQPADLTTLHQTTPDYNPLLLQIILRVKHFREKMTDILRPGFPLRLNSELYSKKEEEEEEYLLKWGEHNNQVVNIFHQLCQVRYQSSRDWNGLNKVSSS